jgi:radical SAM protein with 4Fe4S-binding SPASM domain
MDAIAKLKERKINLTLAVTPNRFMQDDVEPLLGLIHSFGLCYRIGSSLLPARPETGREIADYVVDNEVYYQISKLETEFWKNKNDSKTVRKSNYRFMVKGLETVSGIPCAAGAATFQINWKGEMTPCTAFFTVAKSVLDSSIEDVWQWIRETMQQWQEPAECGTCSNKVRCMGCPGEKTSGVLNGSVNPWVCKQLDELRKNSANPIDCI